MLQEKKKRKKESVETNEINL